MGSWLDGGNKIVLSQKARVQNPSHARDTKHNKQILKPLWQPPTLFWGKGGQYGQGLLRPHHTAHIHPHSTLCKEQLRTFTTKILMFWKIHQCQFKKNLICCFFFFCKFLVRLASNSNYAMHPETTVVYIMVSKYNIFFGRSAI